MILLRYPNYGPTRRNRNLVYYLKPTDVEMEYLKLYENLHFLFFFWIFFLYFLGMETFFLEISLATYSKEFS